MWDVKLFVNVVITYSKSKFYLNYVGCKVRVKTIYISDWDGFTLTMWDVKYYGYNSATWTDEVLP